MNNPVQEFFERESFCYGEQFRSRKSGRAIVFQGRLALAREMSLDCAGSMLDCATGTGEISEAIFASGHFCEATFVDVSPEMLRRAKLRLRPAPDRSVRFVEADIFEYLSSLEPAANFDLIVCLGLIAHTGRLDELLRKFRAHLAGNGRVLLQTSLLNHWGNWLWRLLSDRRATRRHGYAFSYFTQQQIMESVQEAQLKVLAVRRYGVGFPFLEKVSPWANHQLEVSFRNWASRHGAEAIYVLGEPNAS